MDQEAANVPAARPEERLRRRRGESHRLPASG
jgi:hypothetical protein